MYHLQKPTATTSLLALMLAAICCQTIYTQKLKHDAPTILFKRCWVYPTDKSTDFDIASDNASEIYVTLLDGKLISLNRISGEKLWESELGGKIMSAPLVEADNIYIAVSYKNQGIVSPSPDTALTVRSIDKATGITRWKSELADASLSIGEVYLFNFENYLIFVGDNGDVYSIDKTSGQTVWRKSFNAKLSAQPFVKAERLVLGTSDNKILSLSLDDGRLIERLDFPVPLTAIVESANGDNLILGDAKGLLASFNKKSKAQNWKFRNGAAISNIALTPKGLLVTSFDNYVYLISETNGKLFWRKRLAGRVSDEPLINGNYVIVTVNDDTSASVVELDTGKLLNRIVLESDNFFVGESIQTGNYFVYATLKGIFSFSDGSQNCITE